MKTILQFQRIMEKSKISRVGEVALAMIRTKWPSDVAAGKQTRTMLEHTIQFIERTHERQGRTNITLCSK